MRPMVGRDALHRSGQPTSLDSCAPTSIAACCAAHHNAAGIARDGFGPHFAAAAAALLPAARQAVLCRLQ